MNTCGLEEVCFSLNNIFNTCRYLKDRMCIILKTHRYPEKYTACTIAQKDRGSHPLISHHSAGLGVIYLPTQDPADPSLVIMNEKFQRSKPTTERLH